MLTYGVDGKSVHTEARDDAESILLEVVRSGFARSRADRNNPRAIINVVTRGPCSNRTDGSSIFSRAASVAAGPGTSEAAAAGLRRHRLKLSD